MRGELGTGGTASVFQFVHEEDESATRAAKITVSNISHVTRKVCLTDRPRLKMWPCLLYVYVSGGF